MDKENSLSEKTTNSKSWVHTERPELKRINKTRLFTFQIVYSFIDALFLHPLTIAQTVAENHQKPLSEGQRKRSFGKRANQSFHNNLSTLQGIKHIVEGERKKSLGTKGFPTKPSFLDNFRSIGVYSRACFTGFPVLFTSLCLYDTLQFLPQAYLTEKASLSPIVAGCINATSVALICTPLSVIFRQQVKHCCLGLSHSCIDVIGTINEANNQKVQSLFSIITTKPVPNGENCLKSFLQRLTSLRFYGIIPRYYRGLLGSLLAIPQAGISWGLYEWSKDWLQRQTSSTHVWTNLVGGGLSGGIGTVITRPLGAIVARKQLEPENIGYRKIIVEKMWTEEGPGAFYKGLGARIMLSIPRMAVFYSAYSLCMTWAMQ